MGNAVIHFSNAFYYVEYFLIRLKSELNAWFCWFMCSYVYMLCCMSLRCRVKWVSQKSMHMRVKFCVLTRYGKYERNEKHSGYFEIHNQCLNNISNINGFMELMFVIHVANIPKKEKKSVQKFDTFFLKKILKIMFYIPQKYTDTEMNEREFLWEQYQVMRNYAMIAHLFLSF